MSNPSASWDSLPGMTWSATPPPRELADRAISAYWAREAHPWSRRFGRVGEGLVTRYAGELLAWLGSGTLGDDADGYLRRISLSMAGSAARGHLPAVTLVSEAQETYDFIRNLQPARRL